MPTAPKQHRPFQRNAYRERMAMPGQAKAQKLRSSSRYRRWRKVFLSRYPLCCDPFGDHEAVGFTAASQQMHHIEPVVSRPDLALTASNCRALCTACHGRISKMERAGQDARGVFE